MRPHCAPFDRFQYFGVYDNLGCKWQKNCVECGSDRQKAERIATEIFDAIHDNVATKGDLDRVETGLKSDVAAVQADLRLVESALKADIAGLRGEVQLVKHQLITRLGGLMVVVAGLLFAALRMWPPHG
jgi:hypothetical protein